MTRPFGSQTDGVATNPAHCFQHASALHFAGRDRHSAVRVLTQRVDDGLECPFKRITMRSGFVPRLTSRRHKMHSICHFLEVNPVVHCTSSGVAQLMHQHIHDPYRVSEGRGDHYFHDFIGAGGVSPAFTDRPTALCSEGKAACHPDTGGNGFGLSGKHWAKFLSGGG